MCAICKVHLNIPSHKVHFNEHWLVCLLVQSVKCELPKISTVTRPLLEVLCYWSYFQIAGCQPTRLFQTRHTRFWMFKNVENQFKILNVYKL